MSEQKKWKQFERKTYGVVKKLNPGSKVSPNVRIEGKFSKVKREVDVVQVKPESYDLIAFECKDHKRQIDVTTVEGFNTKLDDIGAHKGAIVANSRYSMAARNMAASLGIDLLHLVDTKDPNIKAKIYAKSLLTDTSLARFNVEFSGHFFLGMTIPALPQKLQFVQADGTKRTALEICAHLWNETEKLSREPGNHAYALPNSASYKAVSLDGGLADLTSDIHFKYLVERKHFFGELGIVDAQGLYNVKAGSFQSRHFILEPLIPHEVEQVWKEVSDEEAVSISAAMTFVVHSMLPSEVVEDKRK